MSVDVLQGDCMAILPTLPADHYHCVVTSPPYFALRSYLPAGHPDKDREIGSEPTPAEFIATMVAVFREVRRVMHPSGTLWVNLGDSYGQASCGGGSPDGPRAGRATDKARRDEAHVRGDFPGQLQNIPHRVAEALRADGWIWRQTIVWRKPSPMPESCKGWRWERCRVKVKAQSGNMGGMAYKDVIERDGGWTKDTHPGTRKPTEYTDCPGCPKCSPHGGYVLRRGKGRCTTAHEYIFVFAKSSAYFWDSAAFVEEAVYGENRATFAGGTARLREANVCSGGDQPSDLGMTRPKTGTRNPRSVWTISAEPTKSAHFAAFPTELARRCLQAGTSDGGCCPECGAPWAPVVEKAERPDVADSDLDRYGTGKAGVHRKVGQAYQDWLSAHPDRILGYRPTCDCARKMARDVWGDEPRRMSAHGILTIADKVVEQHLPVPCRTLDPFAGTGTVAQVAQWLGRDATAIELNPEYVAMIDQRLREEPACARREDRNVTVDLPPDTPLFQETDYD